MNLYNESVDDFYNNSYKFQLDYLKGKGVENIKIQSDGEEITLAELLLDYGVEYYQEVDPGEYR